MPTRFKREAIIDGKVGDVASDCDVVVADVAYLLELARVKPALLGPARAGAGAGAATVWSARDTKHCQKRYGAMAHPRGFDAGQAWADTVVTGQVALRILATAEDDTDAAQWLRENPPAIASHLASSLVNYLPATGLYAHLKASPLPVRSALSGWLTLQFLTCVKSGLIGHVLPTKIPYHWSAAQPASPMALEMTAYAAVVFNLWAMVESDTRCRLCEGCGHAFIVLDPRKRHCSTRCRVTANRRRARRSDLG